MWARLLNSFHQSHPIVETTQRCCYERSSYSQLLKILWVHKTKIHLHIFSFPFSLKMLVYRMCLHVHNYVHNRVWIPSSVLWVLYRRQLFIFPEIPRAILVFLFFACCMNFHNYLGILYFNFFHLYARSFRKIKKNLQRNSFKAKLTVDL